MEIINETIKKVAGIKAKAAREAAEEIMIGGVVFSEGIMPGEIEIKEGFDVLYAIMEPEKVYTGYANRCENFVSCIFWFEKFGVKFYNREFIDVLSIPKGAKIFEDRSRLYASV